MDNGARLSIGQVAERTGMSVHTLRYYERAGLLRDDVERANGRRVYTEDHIDWLDFCAALRQAGMSLRSIREYTRVVRRGDGTETERLQLLQQHQRHVTDQMRESSRCLGLINDKIAVYENLITHGLPASSCESPRPRRANRLRGALEATVEQS